MGHTTPTPAAPPCAAAARHAGVIPADGVAHHRAAQDRALVCGHQPQCGVTTSDYGPYTPSRALRGRPAATLGPSPCPQRPSVNAGLPMPFTCICRRAVREGTVWGSNVYRRFIAVLCCGPPA